MNKLRITIQLEDGTKRYFARLSDAAPYTRALTARGVTFRIYAKYVPVTGNRAELLIERRDAVRERQQTRAAERDAKRGTRYED
jgi:hypothetical protein